MSLEASVVGLVDERGSSAAVDVRYLCGSPGFRVVGAQAVPGAPQWGLFEGVSERQRERALAWQRHIQEVECGLPVGPGGSGVPRPAYDPARWSMAEREQAKAEELTALGWPKVSRATVVRMRANYRRRGLWGLVDHRTTRGSSRAGRADERVVVAVLEALRRQRGQSKGTVAGLRRLTVEILDEAHGPGTVAIPPAATFYRLVRSLADPMELPGRPARTATVPVAPFTPTNVLRPGEQVMLDTTRLDVMVVFDQGVVGRPELTIALDVATRSILAAVLRPASTKAVDAALLLAEMAVPHPMRPGWPKVLELSHAAVPYERLLALDARLDGAAARPVIVPESVVVDRGKVFVSEAFLAACETLGVSVQSAPPRQPAAKGPVERTFGSINTLLCQYVAGYTASNVTRRGRDVASQARWTLPQLQDLLDEWITAGWQNRPHEGLRHPMMPRACLSPNEMWGALVAVCGYLPVPLTGDDYTELLPVVWKAVTDRGIRVDHRTYDHAVLNPHRGHPSPVTGQGGKWEVHHNPHDLRQVWIRLPNGKLTEIPWIHRDHATSPFNDHIWQYLKTQVARCPDRDHYEAALVRALDDLLLRARTANTNSNERARTARHITGTARPTDALDTTTAATTATGKGAGTGTDTGRKNTHREDGNGLVPQQAADRRQSERHDIPDPWQPWAESLDDAEADMDELGGEGPETGFPLYNARLEAEQW
ncbi:transposase [Kitasatospora sp. NPDC101155]|uniref:transposase n=1 Tax=Kitasatospora sp. NPDC101155 TaxID=3364097 RepID=UPI00382BEFF9